MPTPAIIERVRELHAELAETQTGAPDVASQANEVRRALDTVLLAPEDTTQYTSLSDRLKAAYAGFQDEHPKVAGAMQGLINELSAAGL